MEHQGVTCLLLFCILLCLLSYSGATGSCNGRFYNNDGNQPYTCPKQECRENEVWGTGRYTYDSSLCHAAWHDGRILPWSDNEEERRVTWSSGFNFDKYYRTSRYGYTTKGFGPYGGRNFTSARVKETLYNISVLVSPTDGDVRVYGGSNVQIGTDVIESGVHVDIGSSSAASAPISEGNVSTGSNAHARYTVQDKFVAYYFTVNKKNLYSWVIVPGVTFPTGDCKEDDMGLTYRGRINTTQGGYTCQRWDSQIPHAHYSDKYGFKENYCRNEGGEAGPWCYTTSSSERWKLCNVPLCTQDHLTQRSSVGDRNVRFNFKGQVSGAKWKKDGGSFTDGSSISIWDGQQTPTIDSVELGHGGVYMVYTEQGSTKEVKGIFRLIVRVCSDGKYGGLCEHDCPSCLNGGVCHDITGECICAPGFKGSDCSEACGPNRFGYDCTSQCSDDTDIGCRYRQVCTIDPYGCSCATGFKGIGCDQECLDNSYGADCLQSCGRCLNAPCDKFRGNCTCQEGYKTPYCKTEIARLVEPPNISRSPTEITVTWRLWSAQTDHGVGPVYKYIVEYRQATVTDWTRSGDVDSAVSSFSIPSTDVQNQYHIRIKIKLHNNDVGNASSEATVCGLPSAAPQNIRISERSTTTLKFYWQTPPCLSSNGPITKYDYQLRRKESPCLSKEFVHDSSSELYQRFDRLQPHVTYSFRVRAVNGKLARPWSTWTHNVTSESTPTPPRNLSVVDMNPTFAIVGWKPPCPPNGVIREYQLKHQNLNDAADNNITTCTDCYSLKVFNLKIKNTYKFKIRAKTTDWGVWSSSIYETIEEGVPDMPNSVYCNERSLKTISVYWAEPSRKNGFLTHYEVSWNAENERSLSVTVEPTILTFKVSDLKPGTRYTVHVAARTSVGFGPPATTVCWTALPDLPDLALRGIAKADMTDTTVIIHLTPATEYSKSVYIKYYLVVVDTLRKNTKRRRAVIVDASSLRGYVEAQRNQEPHYIAANLTAGYVRHGVDFVVGDGKFYGGYMNVELRSGYLYKFLYGVFIENDAENKSHFQVFDVEGAYNGQFVEVKYYNTSSSTVKDGLIIGAVCGSLAFILALGGLGFVFYRKRRTSQQTPQSGEITENINEPGHSKRVPQNRDTAMELSTFNVDDNKPYENNAINTYETTANNRPTSNVYEKIEPNYWMIPFSSISLGDVIGKGSFGDVQSATVVKNNSTIKVALKQLNAFATDKDRVDFIGELNILSQVGSHPNIISLIGACEHQDVLFVATEYAVNGNLRTFLRNSRMDSDYANVGSTTSLSEKQLLQIALDVARGMKHLAASKIIHRDLAARNVLVGEDMAAKISDFGLSRNEDIYVKHTQTRVPIRWIAPESLFDHSYTTKSDVWSFGILMWEIVTLGGTPYSGISSSHLQIMLKTGYRMPQPCNCSEDVYDLITWCWSEDPRKRPSFNVLVSMLEDMLLQRKTFISVTCGDDFVYEIIDSGKDDQ